MRLFFTGKGGAGSWAMRGEQLGLACGAKVAPKAAPGRADAVVLIKRASDAHIAALQAAKVPIIWDVVDAYPQPGCANWSPEQCVEWFHASLRKIKPAGVVFPNKRMQVDCSPDLPSTVIYHHPHIGIAKNPIRDEVRRVGYEGNPKYLGSWGDHIRKECRRRGWEFTPNVGQHADWDICVAFRDGQYNGYAQRSWKSNVKLANCHASGTPFVGPMECGYVETATGAEWWTYGPKSLSAAFENLADPDYRRRISAVFLEAAISVEDCAGDMRAFCGEVLQGR